MPQTKIERRNLTQEFRVSAEGEKLTISGYALLFDSPSEDFGGWHEEIDSHAFDAVMSSNPDCRALFNHDPNCILGRTTANTLHLTLDARGLAYVIDPPDTQVARDLIVSMRRKDVTGSSFGFVTKRDQWTENPDGTATRRILEVSQLLDISPVVYPAYPSTSSQARSLPESMPKELRSKISKRDMSEVTDLACACPCVQCASGSCNICSSDGCADEQCACYNQRSLPISESEHRKMQMRLALLAK